MSAKEASTGAERDTQTQACQGLVQLVVRLGLKRAWLSDDELQRCRPTKRLFTPEIKHMLKDWLIRRRDNPYPSRDEKKRLAIETGLTYTQICNWFANWRRKLKNSERERERVKKSWGHLIKHYNTNARGNVEQFSISSEDSIWEEEEQLRSARLSDYDDNDEPSSKSEHTSTKPNFYMETSADCTQIEPNYKNKLQTHTNPKDTTFASQQTKYKQKMMQKYLRDTTLELDVAALPLSEGHTLGNSGAELSKWLESAAKFTPNKNNYFIAWNNENKKTEKQTFLKLSPRISGLTGPPDQPHMYDSIHHKDELDAAEALANLAFNCRQRYRESNVSRHGTLNVVGS